MTGRIVFEPQPRLQSHRCQPPQCPDGKRPNPYMREGVQHDRYSDFPKGTVWACDCGWTWRSDSDAWRPEGWFARWRRERRSLKDRLDGVDLVLTRHDPGVHLVPDVSADPNVLPPSAAILPPHPPKGAQ